MSEKASEILAQIFNPSLSWNESDQKILKICPSYEDVEALAELLAEDPKEEDLQIFLEAHPRLLMGLCGWGYDSPLAFLVKPSIGTLYKADFAILAYGQGGCRIYLIEIKRSSENLYIRSGEYSEKLREAVRQVEDRNIWLNRGSNIQTFTADTLNFAKSLPQYPERFHNQSFRLCSSRRIEDSWISFGGYEIPIINHIIIIGRWAKLSDDARKRLIHHNQYNNQLYQIFTYDQVARRASCSTWL